MDYHITVKGFDSGLNEVLRGHVYDYRTRRVINPVKNGNDKVCIDSLRRNPDIWNVKIDMPIVIHYKFYCKDKRHDRMNVASAFDKSFQDAMQKVKLIPNDGWGDVLGITADFDIDSANPRVEVVISEWKHKAPPQFWGGWNERHRNGYRNREL